MISRQWEISVFSHNRKCIGYRQNHGEGSKQWLKILQVFVMLQCFGPLLWKRSGIFVIQNDWNTMCYDMYMDALVHVQLLYRFACFEKWFCNQKLFFNHITVFTSEINILLHTNGNVSVKINMKMLALNCLEYIATMCLYVYVNIFIRFDPLHHTSLQYIEMTTLREYYFYFLCSGTYLKQSLF